MEVGLLAALVAGVLSLLSPCSALLLPSFFAYAFASPAAQLVRTTAFYVGLLLTLVPLGVGAAAASRLFYGHRDLLVSTAGWLVVAMGVLMILGRGLRVPFATRLQTLAARRSSPRAGLLSTVLLGAVYGLAGFCSGPVLGAILTMAATQETPLSGGVLLATYALGMALPLFFLALVWDRYDLGSRRWLRGRMLSLGPVEVHSTTFVSGVLLILIGLLFLRFDGTAGITGFLGVDTVDLEFTLQERITAVLAVVPGWVLSGLAAVAAGAWLVRRARRPHVTSGPAPDASSADTPAAAEVAREETSSPSPASPQRATTSSPSSASQPEAPGVDTLARHRQQSLEALDRQAGGQALCRVGGEAPVSLKRGEGAVAALNEVARRHRAQPEEDVKVSAAQVLQAWTTELEGRDGPHWEAYRAGGEQAIQELTSDLVALRTAGRSSAQG